MQYFCVLGQAEPVKSQIVFRFQLLRRASRTIPGVKLHEPAFPDTRSQPVLRPMFPLTCAMLLEAVAHGEIWFNFTTVFLFACSSVHHASLWSMSSLREALEIYSHWGCNYFSIRFGEKKFIMPNNPRSHSQNQKLVGRTSQQRSSDCGLNRHAWSVNWRFLPEAWAHFLSDTTQKK